MSDYGSVYAQCPFYIKDEAYRIKCEGTQNENRLHLVFGDSKKLKKYLTDFCCENYKYCRIYKMQMEKYEEILQG